MGKEKKEIGIEKLIELLNEYERERVNHSMIDFIPYGEKSLNDLSVAQVISKKYGFIKWLVENDKIDKEKIIRAEIMPLKDVNENYLLMLLAIQEQPIEVLVSILK